MPHGVLTEEKHHMLVASREAIAKDAGIPQELLWRPLPAITAGERTWIAKFKQHRSAGFCGLLLTGEKPSPDPLSRIGAIAGCLSRNFVRARVFSLLEVLAATNDNNPVEATCLLIPDFIPDKKTASATPSWKVQQITALLTERWSASNMQTVLYAPSMADIQSEYGSYVGSLIQNHYQPVAI